MLPVEYDELKEQVRRQVESLGAELIDFKVRRQGPRSVLGVTVDKESGISLEECARISETLGRLFEELESRGVAPAVLLGRYDLEVSSPGLDRPFTGEKDYRRAVGKRIRIRLVSQPGRPDLIVGLVRSADDRSVTLAPAKGPEVTIPYDQVAKATLEITI